MKQKNIFFGFCQILLVLSIAGACLIISSCATCVVDKTTAEYNRFYAQINKTSQVFKNKRLAEISPEFWNETNSKSLYIIYEDIPVALNTMPGNANFFTPILRTGIVTSWLDKSARKDSKDLFQKQINGFLQSFKWKTGDYFIEVFTENMNFSKDSKITFVMRKQGEAPSVNVSDEDIVIYFNSTFLGMIGKEPYLWEQPKAPLFGQIGITITTCKTWRDFSRTYNGCLPFAMSFHSSSDYKYKTQLYSKLRQVKAYPFMYMACVNKETDSYTKSEWESQDGKFFEQQLKDIIKDLAKGTADLLKNN